MSLRLSMVENREVYAYKLTNGINIYSVEEAIYLFYNNFKEYSTDFFEDKFIEWVRKELLDIKTADILLDIKQHKNFYQRSIEFLTINDFYFLDEIESISLELFNWDKKGQADRIKIKADKFFKLNMFEKAIQTYKDTLELDLSNGILYNNIGVCYMRLNKFDLALTYLKKAINLSDNTDVIFNFIEVLIENEKFEMAEIYIDKLDEKLLYHKFYYLGELYFKQEKYIDCINHYKEACLLNKSDNVLLKLANVYLILGRYDKVQYYLNNISDNEINILLEKSNIYEKLNNVSMAIKCVEKCNFYNRDNYKLWLKLASLYRKDYNLIKAEGALLKAQSLEPNNKEVFLEQAFIKKSQGKFEEYQNSLLKIIHSSIEGYIEKLYVNNKNK